MEKINDMQQNKIADDELEQVGGGKLFDVFTTEFREFFDRDNHQDDPMVAEKDDCRYGVRTLEMRINPNEKNKGNDRNIIKL